MYDYVRKEKINFESNSKSEKISIQEEATKLNILREEINNKIDELKRQQSKFEAKELAIKQTDLFLNDKDANLLSKEKFLLEKEKEYKANMIKFEKLREAYDAEKNEINEFKITHKVKESKV